MPKVLEAHNTATLHSIVSRRVYSSSQMQKVQMAGLNTAGTNCQTGFYISLGLQIADISVVSCLCHLHLVDDAVFRLPH